MAAKDANVSWLLNFRVCMFFKRAVGMAFKEQGIPYSYLYLIRTVLGVPILVLRKLCGVI